VEQPVDTDDGDVDWFHAMLEGGVFLAVYSDLNSSAFFNLEGDFEVVVLFEWSQALDLLPLSKRGLKHRAITPLIRTISMMTLKQY
ncbi:hypothetical protein PENTCL1PPCAC_4708, partial [Pristionchus entomophagus]